MFKMNMNNDMDNMNKICIKKNNDISIMINDKDNINNNNMNSYMNNNMNMNNINNNINMNNLNNNNINCSAPMKIIKSDSSNNENSYANAVLQAISALDCIRHWINL